MNTAREKLLVAGVEARLAQRKKEERSKLIKATLKVMLLPCLVGGVVLWLRYFIQSEIQLVYPLVLAVVGLGWGFITALHDQHKIILKVEDRVRTLEEKTEPNQALEPTRTAVTDRAGARSAPAVRVAHL
jgi:hypothetical protein